MLHQQQRMLLISVYFITYGARMRCGNIFTRVCLSDCLSVCTVRAITFESLGLQINFTFGLQVRLQNIYGDVEYQAHKVMAKIIGA